MGPKEQKNILKEPIYNPELPATLPTVSGCSNLPIAIGMSYGPNIFQNKFHKLYFQRSS